MASEHLSDDMRIVRYSRESGLEMSEDPVVREISLRIFVNDCEIVALQSLPNEVRELAVGFLYTECILDKPDLIKDIRYKEGLHAVVVDTDEEITGAGVPTVRSITSGCGAGISFVNPRQSSLFGRIESQSSLRAESVNILMRELLKASVLFSDTGGVHTAALSDGSDLIHVSEDIGRHNCLDKIVGWMLLNADAVPRRKIILSSGRLSSDIIAKSIRGGVEFLISHSAPTRGAVQLAQEFGITLIGFARGNRFNIYSNEERILT
ncbi:MAG: formate dehydrogenase accessory sulfurtransferase FdhD [bacterium]